MEISENALSEVLERVSGQSVAYVKLIKNRNGYNWEIKQLSLDLDELEKLNNEMIQRFGALVENE